MERQHKAVLLQPVIDLLAPKTGGTYLDLTLGAGGHFQAIIAKAELGTFVAFDQDKSAIADFKQKLLENGYSLEKETTDISCFKKDNNQIYLIASNFQNLKLKLTEIGITKVDGILADLGLSTDQYADTDKGFSFTTEGELDMRLNNDLQVKASDLINGLYRKELISMFEKLADIRFAKELVEEIIEARKISPITSSLQLKNIVHKIVPLNSRKGTNKHPEAKVFQALRIAVNNELGALKEMLPQAQDILVSGGKLIVISFHSGEDRIVKTYFKELVETNKATFLTKLTTADQTETNLNKRSHSAKLRGIVKT